MRKVAPFLALLFMMSCAQFIPDYIANKTIDKIEPRPMNVYINAYGGVCADQEKYGRRYKNILVSVVLNGPPAKMSFENNTQVVHKPAATSGSYRYKAAPGWHGVIVNVEGYGTWRRSFTVYKCA